VVGGRPRHGRGGALGQRRLAVAIPAARTTDAANNFNRLITKLLLGNEGDESRITFEESMTKPE